MIGEARRGGLKKHRSQNQTDNDRYGDREDENQSRERLIFFHPLPLCLGADCQRRDLISRLSSVQPFERLLRKEPQDRGSTLSDLPDISPTVPSSGEAGASRKIPPTRSMESMAQRGPIRCLAPEHIHRDASRALTRRYRVPELRPGRTVRLWERSLHALGTS